MRNRYAAIGLALAVGLVALSPLGYLSAQTVACEQDYTAADGALDTAWQIEKREARFGKKRLGEKREAKVCIPSKADAEQLMNESFAAAGIAVSSLPTFTATPTDVPSTVVATATEPPSTATAASSPPTPTATATLTPLAVTATGLSVEDVTFGPYGLGKEIVGVIVPAAPYDNSEPPGPVGAPEHVAFRFDGEDRLWVLPSQEFQQQWNAAGNDTVTRAVTQLRTLLNTKPTDPKPPLPFVPPVPATNDLAARVRNLDFDGGSGIAYLARWAQDPSPVLASQVYFTFLGLTNDGKYLVAFRYPVHTSALPDTVDELTPEHLAEIEADPETYFAQTTDLLNKLRNSDFGPDLSRPDALVQSISVPSTGQVLPTLPSGGATPSAGGTPNPQVTPRTTSTSSGGDVVRLRTGEWRWLRSVTPEETVVVNSPESYSLRFNNAGGFGITADCNIGAGNYTVNGDRLIIEDLQSTLVFCGDESQDAIFTGQLVNAERYSFQGNNLLLYLADDGGTMHFGR